MVSTNMTRRSFAKAMAVAGAASALGAAGASNLVESDKAWAEDAVEEIRTSCRACIANCGVIATVSNGRVIHIKGDPIDPMSKGRVCPKGLSGVQALYHPNRNKYPLRRVGEKPGNNWERISWDEACLAVAQAMIDMRDKTGKHGLLCSTGGGGNPQFFSPPRFRNFWGAGNVFEPGCAQCYLPRNYTMGKVNGLGDTSIADSGCTELYKPAKYGNLCEVYVMWGTGPAWHSPATSGRCVAELRANGCKTIVIDPRFNADASKADVWLPIKPGTDMAMILGWMNYIIENELYAKIPDYEDFCEQWTNLPFLVDPRDEVSLPSVAGDISRDGKLLRASEVFQGVDASNEGYVYFDLNTNSVNKAFALGPDNADQYKPQLFGTVDVTLKDGSVITCKTAFQAYKDRCADYDLDTVAEITGCKKEKIIEAIELYCSTAHGGISLGVATDMYPGSAQAAIGAAALDCMTAHLWHSGCPANSVGPRQSSLGLSSAESTIFPSGFFGETKYQFQKEEAILERLGYCEHKGLGGWMHSHIPTVLSAVLTGEPYQPKVWIERSGNKMAALGNAASWVDAFPKFDMIVHGYMYPTSFTTEAADIVFPICEWLENSFAQNRINVNLLRVPVTNLFEAADEIMMWGKIAQAMADPNSELYDENMEACWSAEMIGSPMVAPYWDTINDYWDYVAQQCGNPEITTMEEARKIMPQEWCPADEYWGSTVYDGYLEIAQAGGGMGGPGGAPGGADSTEEGGTEADQGLTTDPNGVVPEDESVYLTGTQEAVALAAIVTEYATKDVYTGFSTAAADIMDNPMKCGPYSDQMLYIGRHGNESFEMPASIIDWNPMPYYFTPEDETNYGDDYPLALTEGRIPYYHHGTLRNNPYLRELYPAPEIWIAPADAEAAGIQDGDWVNIKSPRTDGLDVFRDITTGLNPTDCLAKSVTDGPSEFVPGDELTASGQAVVSDGIYAIASVTKGIPTGSVYMERFWNPEFLQDGSDGRKSWTTMNMNVLSKNTGYYNPEFGTYTLRGIRVKIEKSQRPEGIWYEAEDFAPWMPEPSDFTGGAYYVS